MAGSPGAQGNAGPAGATGATGPKGDTGSIGPAGANGAVERPITPFLTIAEGGTNGGTQADARTGLGLVIGVNVEAHDATLTALAAVVTAANKLIYATGPDTFSTTDLTVFARTLIAAADVAAAQLALALRPGVEVQAYDVLTAKTGTAYTWARPQAMTQAALAAGGTWNCATNAMMLLSGMPGTYTLSSYTSGGFYTAIWNQAADGNFPTFAAAGTFLWLSGKGPKAGNGAGYFAATFLVLTGGTILATLLGPFTTAVFAAQQPAIPDEVAQQPASLF